MKKLGLPLFYGAFAFSFFAAPSFAAAAAREAGVAEKTAHPSRLEKLREEGNVYGFRIELEKLLAEPAKDFFSVMENFFNSNRRRKAFQSMALSLHSTLSEDLIMDKVSQKAKSFAFEEITLGHVLTPPLGKTDRHGLTPSAAAARAGNPSAAALFRKYEAADHEIYEGQKDTPTVWEQNPEIYPAKEDSPLRRLPFTPLEKTAVGRALLNGDLMGFVIALDDLYKGPAWKVLALLHSRETKTRKTVFHLLAEAKFPAADAQDRKFAADRIMKNMAKNADASGFGGETVVQSTAKILDLIDKVTEARAKNRLSRQESEEYLFSLVEEDKTLSGKKEREIFLKAVAMLMEVYPPPSKDQVEFQAAEALERLIETVVPREDMIGFRKDKAQAEATHIQAMLFTGTASALSLVSSVAAYGMDQNIIGSGLAVLSGWTLMRCRRVFKSYKKIKEDGVPP